MDVAISGDRSSCLSIELEPGAYAFAVAHGFGRIDGEPVAPAVLSRLRGELERRARGRALRRAQARPKGISALMTAAFSRTNEYVHARSASHEDYVTAGCSLTAAVLVGDRAYLSHVGSTAAYLARDGYAVSLTKQDAFEGPAFPVLTRALGADNVLEVALCTFSLTHGDSLVLAARRLSSEELQAGACDEQVLVVRYTPETASTSADSESVRWRAAVTGVLATVLFYALLCLK